jgi:hypothetical protein
LERRWHEKLTQLDEPVGLRSPMRISSQRDEDHPYDEGANRRGARSHRGGLILQELPDQFVIVTENAPEAVGNEQADDKVRKDIKRIGILVLPPLSGRAPAPLPQSHA